MYRGTGPEPAQVPLISSSCSSHHVKRKGEEFPEKGVPTLYTDVVANLRSRVKPDPGDESFMLCIAEVEASDKIEQEMPPKMNKIAHISLSVRYFRKIVFTQKPKAFTFFNISG